MRKGLLAITALVLLAALPLAGCVAGGYGEKTATPLPSGVTPSPLPSVNPTETPEQLITLAEAETLLGCPLRDVEPGKTKPPQSNPSEGMSFAVYSADGNRFLQVTVHQRNEENAVPVPYDVYDRLKRNAKDPIDVKDVGDDAFIAPPGLHMMAEGFYVTISVGNPADPANRALLERAGKLVAEKLKAKYGKK